MNKLWLDLELREDVDDFFTLLYALENNFPVEVVSIHNPSIKELTLLNYTFSLFDVSIPVYVSGFITAYPNGKDLAPFTDSLIPDLEPVEYSKLSNINPDFDISGFTVFCGGSLTTLSFLIDNFNSNTFEACIQGGFASYKVVGKENTLKKFKNREKVPSWNLGLDFESTKNVLTSDINKKFISKNICHNSFVHKNDITNTNTITNRLMLSFFETNKFPDKCMHDLLAFLTLSEDLVEFIPVNLKYEEGDRVKWWSEIENNSNTLISKSFNKEAFLSRFKSN